MKKWIIGVILALSVGGCRRYEPVPELPLENGAELENTTPDLENQAAGTDDKSAEGETAAETEEETAGQEETLVITTLPERTPVKVKGIYVSAYAAGTKEKMDEIIRLLDETELNAVVIDVKDDNGRITFDMDSPQAQAIGACVNYIPDIEELAATLKEHGVYMIARIPAFRDPYLAEAMPEWCLKLADGTVFRDRNQLAWVNPYQEEVWDYLVEIGKMAGEAGFDEIQFDYIRFCTEKGMEQVVFDPEVTKGRSRQEIIQEFVDYAYQELRKEGLFVSADVFGAVIGGGQDAETVGQEYSAMAEELDYISPMIYPSHYADGNFGIEQNFSENTLPLPSVRQPHQHSHDVGLTKDPAVRSSVEQGMGKASFLF